MSNAATMTSLLTRLQANVDRTFSSTSFITTTQATQWLNDGLSRIHYLMAESGEDYFKASQSITLVSGTSTYALNSDFYKVKGVDLTIGGYTYSVHRYMVGERNMRQNAAASGPGYYYRIHGQNIVIIPTPGTGTLVVNYVPTFTPISGGTHVEDAVPDGWEDYAVNYAAAMCRRKAEEDPSDFEQKASEWWAIMVKFFEPRDQAEPLRVTDIHRRWERDPWDYWPGSH